MQTFEKARAFLYRNARPLDLARFRWHFENGSREDVLTALSAYQNADGGFGHALEPDSWNPNSAPIQTWVATEMLREIGYEDGSHPIVQGILRYLAGGQDFDGCTWSYTNLTTNDYPHAPWWHTESNSTGHAQYNPTASLAGFILRFAERGELWRLGARIAREAFEHRMADEICNDMHTTTCYINLLEDCRRANVTDVIDLDALEAKLRRDVRKSITQETAAWEHGYICKPSQFFNCPDSVFCADNRDIAGYECEYIVRTQLDDGSWNIPWNWGAYPDEWAVSKNWWKGSEAVKNLLYLKGFGKL